MALERLEVRLDKDRRRKLDALASERGLPVSEVVRKLIDAEYEREALERRRAAVRRMAELNIEDVPEPDELKRQLESTYDVPDLY